MDYDEQHRICEKEFEVDDAYTVAMDAMPEHWKEEADAQLTYLRHMHICSTSMLLFAVLICFSLLDEAGFPFEIDGGIPFQPSGSSFGRFPCSESFNARGLDYHKYLETYSDMGRPMSVRSEIGNRSIDMGSPMSVGRKITQIAPLTWGAPCQCVRKLVH